MVVGAVDRMLTSGDVQFEPSTGSKILSLTNSIFVMTAGDAALQAEILSMVFKEVTEKINKAPKDWLRVNDVADIYVKYYNVVRNKRAANLILAPLYLTGEDFIARQKEMAEGLVKDLAKELLNFDMPGVATIVCGIDLDGAHIYTVHNDEINCADSVGFAAIGIGRRHAASQLMWAAHAWNSPFPDTLLLTYCAKKRAEVAPGVGLGTDMAIVGPGLASFIRVGDHVLEKLQKEYQRISNAESRAFTKSRGEIESYVEELTQKAQEAADAAGTTQNPPATNGGKAPTNGAAVREPGEKEKGK
jgi:hypothetical protein